MSPLDGEPVAQRLSQSHVDDLAEDTDLGPVRANASTMSPVSSVDPSSTTSSSNR
jgi:hypothetical protein